MAMEPRGENRWRFRVTKDGILYSTNFFGTEKEAETAHDAFRVDVERGLIRHGKSMKFGDYADLFYKQHMIPYYSPITTQDTISKLESRVLPELGNRRLDKIKTIHLNSFYTKLSKDLAPSSIKTIHATLSTMFNRGIEWGLIEENPCERAKLPKRKPKKTVVYNYDELALLLAALETCSLKTKVIILLALGCMMRSGEISALTENDINFKCSIISIDKAAKAIIGKGVIIGTPKTPSSVRDVYVPEVVMDVLLEYMSWLKKNPNAKNTKGYLFPSRNGNAMNPSNANACFDSLIKKNNLRKIPFHDLRHTGASVLMYGGVNLQTISNTLGHSNTKITSEVYLHKIKNADHVGATAMNNEIKKIGQK